MKTEQKTEPLSSLEIGLKDLQKSSLQGLLISMTGIIFLLVQTTAYAASSGQHRYVVWVVATLCLGITSFLSYQQFRRDRINRASIILMTGLVLVVSILLVLPGSLLNFMPYLLIVVVAISGLLIMPYASFVISIGGSILAYLTVTWANWFFNDGEMYQTAHLVAPNMLSLIVALITWAGANNLITAYHWAIHTKKKYAKRGDELFDSQQKLDRANKMYETANLRLGQSQAELEQTHNELQETHEELEHVVEDLRALNASKDKFFSIVAHDLRGPFMPLLGTSELLAEMGSDLSSQQVEELGASLNRSAKNVYDLLNNLLEWSRLQMGRMEYDPQTINLTEIINRNLKLLVENAVQKELTLQGEETETELTVYADEQMIDTVLRNLITNALKFTPKGGTITICSQEKGQFVEASVVDTGVGISAEDVDKLFKIDVHHSTSGTANEQGTGLGLIMCKEMVEQNGGQIWVESEIGKGTTFAFTVPVVNLNTANLLPDKVV